MESRLGAEEAREDGGGGGRGGGEAAEAKKRKRGEAPEKWVFGLNAHARSI